MTEHRKLIEEEERVCSKSLERVSKELDYQLYLLEYADLMLTTGLYQNFLAKKREFEQNRKETKNNIEQLKFTIDSLKDQIENGVEVKQNNANFDKEEQV